ncbi:transposase [Streptomyces pimonensis]|uniref:transposase n=1 Tax=Streptomyces pimonensis TaxID=2860288 RepID=UPI003F9F9E6B
MARPSRYPLELRRRAVRMTAEVRGDHPNKTAALQAVADKPGIGSREAPRIWVKQHETDAGQRPGTTTEESTRLKALRKENAEPKRANEILKAAASSFAAEFDRPHTCS